VTQSASANYAHVKGGGDGVFGVSWSGHISCIILIRRRTN